MANPSLQIGNDNWAIKEDNLLGYSTAGTRFVPQPITMTRATLGTRVNPSGLVENVQIVSDTELITNGDFATDSDWSKGTGWTISGGTANCDGSQTGTSNLNNSVSNGLVNNVSYVVKYTISNYSAGSIRIKLGNTGYGDYNSANGTYTATLTALVSTFPYAQFNADSSFVGSIDNVSVKEATIDNLPRVDYTDGTSSLLVEPQRKNEITYSEDFEKSGWGIYNSTLETDAVISPNGILNATKLIGTNDVTAHTLYTNAYTVVASVDYTHSVFIKKSQSKYVQLYTGSGFGNYYANFNLEDGIVETFTTLDANIENIGDGWYKCSTKANSSTTTAQSTVALIDTATSGRGYAFNAEDESVYIWGAQIEEGSYPTSYIKTSGSTVTRNQETYTKTGISDKIGQTEGTFFIELSKPVLEPDSYYLISLNNAASNSDDNSVAIGFENSNDFFLRVQSNGTDVFYSNNFDALNVNTFYKIAVSYKSGQSLIYIDGSPITPNGGNLSNAFAFTATLDNLSFDFNGNNGLPFFGKVKQLQVFKTALTGSELATLTT